MDPTQNPELAMVHVVLFHSATGLKAPVHAFAEALRSDGHVVATPDLFEGQTFATTEAGIVHRDALGIEVLMGRAMAAAADLPDDVVYAGFSMGAAAACALAVSKPGARGALLMHGAVPLSLLGVPQWPAVPVGLHTSPADLFCPDEDVASFAASVRASAPLEHHAYAGTGHLFSHADMPEHDAAAAALLLSRVRDFLAGLERPKRSQLSGQIDQRRGA
jgi:dienelactone hydrolase